MPETGGAPGAAVTLCAENARLRMLLEDKDAQIAALKTQNAELAERVARLERLISRNSGNSSMPPSTDDLPGKKPPERTARRGGGRKPGKQPGAPGAYLADQRAQAGRRGAADSGRAGCGAGGAGEDCAAGHLVPRWGTGSVPRPGASSAARGPWLGGLRRCPTTGASGTGR